MYWQSALSWLPFVVHVIEVIIVVVFVDGVKSHHEQVEEGADDGTQVRSYDGHPGPVVTSPRERYKDTLKGMDI